MVKILISLAIATICMVGCKKDAEQKVDNPFSGKWTAQWDTDPLSFPEAASNSIFTMDGSFDFSPDQNVTVTA
jgi:hypothetical protein